MKKVAVIGSNGFVGRHLVQRLMQESDIELLLFGRSEVSYFKNQLPYKKIKFSDPETLKSDFTGVELVYYLASETIPASSWEDPLLELTNNLTPFIRFLEAVSATGLKRVAFISSAGTVYGTTIGKVNEDVNKLPYSPYGITKLAMENYLNYYRVKRKVAFDIYRVSNVYGPGQDTSKGLGIINTFLEAILRDGSVKVFGDGSSTRNYIYVKDVAELMALSLRNRETSGIFNVSSNDTLTINRLIDILKLSIAQSFKVNYLEGRQSDNSFIDLDNQRILAEFENFKFTTIEDGVKKTYKVLKEQLIKN